MLTDAIFLLAVVVFVVSLLARAGDAVSNRDKRRAALALNRARRGL